MTAAAPAEGAEPRRIMTTPEARLRRSAFGARRCRRGVLGERSTVRDSLRCAAAVIWILGATLLAGCADEKSAPTSSRTAGSSSRTDASRASALALGRAMADASRSIDSVEGTRESLERLATNLQPPIARTSDAIAGMGAAAATDGTVSRLLVTAREQRSFLQFAVGVTTARSSKAAGSSLERARQAGRRASDGYQALAESAAPLAGVLPQAPAFNTGRLRDARKRADARPSPRKRSVAPPAVQPPSAPPPAPGYTGDWPGGAGYTVVLASVGSSERARAIQAQGSARGLDAGILFSSNFSSLRPGYWVVFSGVFSSAGEAAARQSRARSLGYGSAYARFVAP
jgi:hypothetical protein